jgi:hypothetical protein
VAMIATAALRDADRHAPHGTAQPVIFCPCRWGGWRVNKPEDIGDV